MNFSQKKIRNGTNNMNQKITKKVLVRTITLRRYVLLDISMSSSSA